ncbi:MAG: heparin lyase I family protein [Lentilitoribacter sp.]
MFRILSFCLVFAVGFFVTSHAFSANDRILSILANTKLERGRGEIGHRKSYGFKRVQDITRRGSRSQRFEIRHGDCNGSKQWNDCEQDRARIERKEAPRNRLIGKAKKTWLGFSIYVPEDHQNLYGKSRTSVIQTKIQGVHMPSWQLFLDGSIRVVFHDNEWCRIGLLPNWKGKWTDITIFADYTSKKQDVFFELYVNGDRVCTRQTPIIHPHLVNSRFETYLKYGIYQNFVSRHLKIAGEIPQNLPEKETTAKTVKWPFRYDWGVKLPTQIVYFDEMLAGQTRSEVDVRMREASGLSPVD